MPTSAFFALGVFGVFGVFGEVGEVGLIPAALGDEATLRIGEGEGGGLLHGDCISWGVNAPTPALGVLAWNITKSPPPTFVRASAAACSAAPPATSSPSA
mmetsp:Transcript_29875/g.83924  ORF Transcript_29875/g.83924 Transcript_29875/m.83924 type:complete len:100 (+) Transcript_29875:101-400(+)